MHPTRVTAVAFVLLLLGLSYSPAAAETSAIDADIIKAGLRTATPEEDGFIERVVGLVDQGKVPAKLVDSTFQWARQKPRHKFQYFKRALILRARRIGIDL
jgi:hypothetical protein